MTKLKPDRVYKDGPFIFCAGTIKFNVITHKCEATEMETIEFVAEDVIEKDDGSVEYINCAIKKGE